MLYSVVSFCMALEILLKGIAAFTGWNRTWLRAYIVFKFNMYYNSRTVGGMILICVETWIIISYNITGLRDLPVTEKKRKKQKRKILMEPQKKKKNIGVLAARDANTTSGKLLFFFTFSRVIRSMWMTFKLERLAVTLSCKRLLRYSCFIIITGICSYLSYEMMCVVSVIAPVLSITLN